MFLGSSEPVGTIVCHWPVKFIALVLTYIGREIFLQMLWLATDKVCLSPFPTGGAPLLVSFLLFYPGIVLADHTIDFYCNFVCWLIDFVVFP